MNPPQKGTHEWGLQHARPAPTYLLPRAPEADAWLQLIN
jgi:hypothetical protein